MKILFWITFLSMGLQGHAYGQDLFSHQNAESVENAEKNKDRAEEERVQSLLQKNPQLLAQSKGLVIGNTSQSPHIFVFVSPYCPHCKGIVSDFLALCEKNPSLTVCLFFIAHSEDPAGFSAVQALSISHQQGKFKEAFQELNQSMRFLSMKEWKEFAEKEGIAQEDWENGFSDQSIKDQIDQSTHTHEEMGFSGVPTVIIQEGGHIRLINGKPQNATALEKML
jgi:protein-disulfide isomerase